MTPVSFEVSLFGDPRIEARLPAPRGLSQVTTSFIGSWCLGTHRLPLVACYFTTKMLASTVQFSRNGRAQFGDRIYRLPLLVRVEEGC